MANRSLLNETDTDQDDDEREKIIREVQAMLREMRYRSCVGQKKLAEKEKMEAENCEFLYIHLQRASTVLLDVQQTATQSQHLTGHKAVGVIIFLNPSLCLRPDSVESR